MDISINGYAQEKGFFYVVLRLAEGLYKNDVVYYEKDNSCIFTALNGKEKWTAYKFTKNVYDKWMPIHLKRIYVIDDLPLDPDFEVSE
ncbi:hypothetical protein V8E51_012929 [Hyaloscypha variabilis]